MFFTLLGVCVFLYFVFYLICVFLFDCDVRTGFAEKFGKSVGILKGQVVFITGASSGIGEYTALALARRGVKLVLSARRKEELERVKGDCLAKSQGLLQPEDVLVLPMDVTNIASHQKCFDDVLRHFGRVDILVNNAGRSQRANWENIDMSVDKQMFDLNVFGVVSLTRIAVRYFQSRPEGGHVAVTSSIAGIVGAPFSGTYTATKHAIHGYFNSLRTEKLMNNITVSIFCPGPTFTNFLSQCFTEQDGQTYGIDVKPTDRRMTGERCGELCAVALANKLHESWLALFPLIALVYVAVYSPVIYNLALKIVGPQKLYKMRDFKDDIELPATNTSSS
ncbi:uncharacterized protein CBL_03551 [Carabus blaptoides fortunei]